MQVTYGYQLVYASCGTVYASYDGSKSFTVLVFRAVGNSNFSTADYYTVELAPTAAKLTAFLRSKIKGKVIFYNTRHEQWLEHCYSRNLQSRNTKLLPSKHYSFVLI